MSTLRIGVKAMMGGYIQSLNISDVMKHLPEGVVKAVPSSRIDSVHVLITDNEPYATTFLDAGKVVVMVGDFKKIEESYPMGGLVVLKPDQNKSPDVAEGVKEAVKRALAIRKVSHVISSLPSRLEQSGSTSLHTLKRNLGIHESLVEVQLDNDVLYQTTGLLKAGVPINNSDGAKAKVKLLELPQDQSPPANVLADALTRPLILASPFGKQDVTLRKEVRQYQIENPSARIALVFFDGNATDDKQALVKSVLEDGLNQINHRAHLSAVSSSKSPSSAAVFNEMAGLLGDLPLGSAKLFQRIVA